MTSSSAIVAVLTSRGRGAVATIGYRGDAAPLDAAKLFRAANGKSLAAQPVDRIVFGRWGDDPAEDVVVCRVALDRLEVHCHGGEAAVNRILAQLESLGATRVPWRSYLEQIEGPFAADVAAALAAAATTRTAAIVARQAAGPLRDALRRLDQADLGNDREETLGLLHRMIRQSTFGLHLTQPWQVVLYGPPNVGKSSLINALVGFERAIVFDQPGTTRDVVTAETAFDGWPIRFSDTAGLRANAGELEAAGIERAKATLAEADLRVLVLDRSRPTDVHLEMELASLNPHLTVLNKADLPDARGDDRNPPVTTLVSAKSGTGVRDLLSRIANQLVPAVPDGDEPIPVVLRQIEAIQLALDSLEAGDTAAYRAVINHLAP